MKMNRRISSIIFVVISGAAVTAFIGNGCAKQLSSEDGASMASTSVAPSCAGGPAEAPFVSGVKTVSLVYANQVLDHFMSCLGLAKASDLTLQTYENKKGAISTYGAYNTITPPMMMAITSIVGEVCNDLIAQEVSAGTRLFQSFNFAANALPSDAALKDAVTRMALSCWQRQDENTERQEILDMVYKNIGATEAQGSRKAALMICTAMLSSLDALLN